MVKYQTCVQLHFNYFFQFDFEAKCDVKMNQSILQDLFCLSQGFHSRIKRPDRTPGAKARPENVAKK